MLDAAVECLAELGYARTTLPEVLRRAGLSNGAMWRHFPSKLELLVATTQEIDLRPDDATLAALDGLADPERIDRALDQLFDLTTSTTFQASIELIRASRADTELREALLGVDRISADRFFDALRARLGSDLAASPDFERNARVLALAIFGTAVAADLRARAASTRVREEFKQVGRDLFLGKGRSPRAAPTPPATARARHR